jgi:hypothetical protein
MANRYWVGGAGTWDGSSTTRWSATSGGASGASAPTSTDNVFFNSSGGSGTVTIASGATCQNFVWSSTTLTMGGSANFQANGSIDMGVGLTITYSGTMTFSSASSPNLIFGTTIPFNVIVTGGGTFSFQFYEPVFTGTFTLNQGDLDMQSIADLTVGKFAATGSGTKVLTFSNSNIVVTGSGANAFDCSGATNLTTVGGLTGAIKMSSSSAKTFAGNGNSFPFLVQTGTGTLTISGSNTFEIIDNTVQPTTITFTSGTTQTLLTSFGLSGTAGNLVTINATTTSPATLTGAGIGTINVSYCSISYSTATGSGGTNWNALTSNGNVNAGGNSGWNFGKKPANFFVFF